MKRCRECGLEKPLEDYYRHSQMGDGHLNKCKACVKTRVTTHRGKNLARIQRYDRTRARRPERKAAMKAYQLAHRDEYNQHKRRHLERHPDRRNATVAVGNAIRDGRLVKEPCVICGNSRVQAHHLDYSKPLEVTWLCPTHHGQVHSKDYDLELP